MCAGQGYQQPTDESSVTVNTVRSVYRVLRGSSRGELRSVNRNPAGRNPTSVKVLSPVKTVCPRWPSNYAEAKAAPGPGAAQAAERRGTAGVRVRGMHEGLVEEPRRSPASRARPLELAGRGLSPESAITLAGEVRSSHSSREAE